MKELMTLYYYRGQDHPRQTRRLAHQRRAGGIRLCHGRHSGLSGELRRHVRRRAPVGCAHGGGRGGRLLAGHLRLRAHRFRPGPAAAAGRPAGCRRRVSGLLHQHLQDRHQVVRGGRPQVPGAAVRGGHPFLHDGLNREVVDYAVAQFRAAGAVSGGVVPASRSTGTACWK
ncbi:MAG: hypothetical protein MZU95_00335 [Desulfomicrobium escambiense]|nr:hypothetical protein [Desulfomicrobium escambiense]